MRRFWIIAVLVACRFLSPQASLLAAGDAPLNYWADGLNENMGLPQNTVTAVLQSKTGYLWLGTPRGLVRYDGVRLRTFDSQNVPELRDQHDQITCLAEDQSGVLWAGTKQGGVLRIEDGRFGVLGSAHGLPDLGVTCMCVDAEGHLWVGTDSGGVFQYRDGDFTSYPVFRDWQGQYPRALVAGGRGRVWVATSRQFGVIQDGELRILADAPTQRADTVHIAASGNGGLWVTFDGRLLKYDDEGRLEKDIGRFLPPGQAGVRVTALMEDSRQQVWIATYGRGMFCRTTGAFRPVENDRGERQVLALREDREGNIWVGVRGAQFGLLRLKERFIEVVDTTRGLRAPVVTSVHPARSGGLWVGTDGGGLHNLSQEGVKHVPLDGGGDRVWAVLEDSRTNLWVGTENGLYRMGEGVLTNFGPATQSFSIRALHEDSNGFIWAGTADAGVCRISADSFRQFTEQDGLANNDVRAVQEDASGHIWIATSQGVCMLSNGVFHVTTSTNGLPSDLVRTLYLDRDGQLWVGTGRGLAVLVDGRWNHFNSRTGRLPDDTISQIIEDTRGNLWIGSNKGVFRLKTWELLGYVRGRAQTLSKVLYGASDGLKTPECNGGFQPSVAMTSDGHLYFPTLDGLAEIDLARVRQNDRVPGVVIESLIVDDKPVQLDGPIRLPPGGGRYEIAYTGFNYSAPRLIRFRYKLEGFDADWVDGGSGRLAVYHLLPPGSYKFRLIAGIEDSTSWNEIGKSLEFVILPPFWRTWWFAALIGLLITATALSVYRFITVLQLRRRLRELERQQALERERSRIAKDVHDDLGARLTQIGIIGELIRRDAAKPATAELAEKLTRATREVSESVDEIVWAVNPSNDTLDRLVPYLLNYAEEFLEPTTIRYRLNAPDVIPPLPVKSDARHNIFLVLKETLNNAVKHARASELQVNILCEASTLTVEVRDNGLGFEISQARPLGNGLTNMRKRMEEIGGSWTITTAPGKGTTTLIKLPLQTTAKSH